MRTILCFVLLCFSGVAAFICDDYPITDKMLENRYVPWTIDSVTSFHQAWFKNDTLRETIVINLYTDYHRMHILHLKNGIDGKLISEHLKLHINRGSFFDTANAKTTLIYFSKFKSAAPVIASSYFITNKKFSLGCTLDNAIKIYGKKFIKSKSEGYCTLKWTWVGEYALDSLPEKPKDIIAKESYGCSMTIIFQDGKAIVAIMENVAP